VLNLGHMGRSVSANFSSRIFRFSTFEVNLHTGELRQRGQKVKLQEQPLQVLAALLGNSASEAVATKLLMLIPSRFAACAISCCSSAV
jgi:hypothetical protein